MVTTAVHPSGKLGYVQGVGKEPVPSSQVTYNSSADFGVGVFLLAGSEVIKMAVDGKNMRWKTSRPRFLRVTVSTMCAIPWRAAEGTIKGLSMPSTMRFNIR